MANPPDVTQIPAPRVDFIDKRTGLMAREWYRFFVNLYDIAGGGASSVSLDDLQLGPSSGASTDDFAEMMKTLQELEIQPPVVPSSGSGTTYSVFTSTTDGLAPASGGGTTNYLRADGTWTAPPGTGSVTFANPTATVGPTAVNGTALTAMRSDASPALNLSANYDVTGVWRFDSDHLNIRENLGAGSYRNLQIGWVAGPEVAFQTFTAPGANYGFYLAGTKYLSIATTGVNVPTGTLSVASTSVRDGAILTSGTVAAARLPSFGTAAAGIVSASGGGTVNYLRADATWASPTGGIVMSSGVGSPNGVIVGSPGDIYSNTSGGAGTTLYVKESGSATNTGWVAK